MNTDNDWQRLFEQANASPPPGFETRHDQLLQRLTTQAKRQGLRRLPLKALIALMLALVAVGALAAGNILGLGDFFQRSMQGNHLKPERLTVFEQQATPLNVKLADINITLHELIADGRWAYASVMAEPLDKGLLLVPFGISNERPLGLSDSEQYNSYLEYAQAKQLKLVDLSVYLESEALTGDYFMDQAYDEQGRLMLYMGGETPGGGQGVYKLRVMISQDAQAPIDHSYPLQLRVHDQTLTRVYPVHQPVGDSGITLLEARLTQTALCTYLDITQSGGEPLHADLMRGGEAWPRGLSIDVNGYEMDRLPDMIDIRLEHPATGQSWDIKGLKGQ